MLLLAAQMAAVVIFGGADLKTDSLLSEFRTCWDELRSQSRRIDNVEYTSGVHEARLASLERKRR